MEIRQDLVGSDAGQQQWAGLLAEYLGRGLDRLDAMSSPDIRMESSQCVLNRYAKKTGLANTARQGTYHKLVRVKSETNLALASVGTQRSRC